MKALFTKSLTAQILVLSATLLLIGGCCCGSKECGMKNCCCSTKKMCPAMDLTKMQEKGKAQTMCPVMDGKINKSLYADVKGYRIYVCCPECIEEIKEDPDKYIKKLHEEGVKIEKTPVMKKDK